jgi:hypothetical protein
LPAFVEPVFCERLKCVFVVINGHV